MKSFIWKIINIFGLDVIRLPYPDEKLIQEYKTGNYIPWSNGYVEYKNKLINSVLANSKLLDNFRSHQCLSENYGCSIDERCVEYPWYFANANAHAKKILDAGSALNHEFILK